MKEFIIDLKQGIVDMFKGSSNDNLFSLNGRVPLKRSILFGIQHVLAMFVANIVPLIIVFSAIGVNNTPIATHAMLSALFMAGFGTIVQLLVGARLPIIIGTSFTFVGLFITIGLSGSTPEEGYYTIMASILVGGAITTVASAFAKYWTRFIKPIVPAIVVLGIGLSLIQSGANQFIGMNDFTPGGVKLYLYIIVAVITFVVAILWQILMKGVWKNLNVIVGIVVGYIVAVCIPGMVDFSGLKITSISDVLSYPSFIDLSKLNFKLVPIILTTVCFLMALVEAIGDTSALCDAGLGRAPSNRELTGTLVCDSLNSTLCSLFGCMPLTTFSQDVGIVSQTKVVNRFTLFVGAVFLVIASFFKPIANFLYTIPNAVLGGVMVIVFGSISAVGMKMVSENGFTQKNILIVSVSVCLGFGLTLCTDFFNYLRSINLAYLADVLSNNVLNMFVIAIILSFILPDNLGEDKPKEVVEEQPKTE